MQIWADSAIPLSLPEAQLLTNKPDIPAKQNIPIPFVPSQPLNRLSTLYDKPTHLGKPIPLQLMLDDQLRNLRLNRFRQEYLPPGLIHTRLNPILQALYNLLDR